MTDPVTFLSATPRLALPLLYAGQSQKEVSVNEALVVADLLLHGMIEGERADPPVSPLAGQMWLVGTASTGDWSGQTGNLAGWTEGGWRFVFPRSGMRLFDQSTGAFRLFDGVWRLPDAPEIPSGGTVVDEQARTAIAELIAILSAAGTFA